jgi:hypothetical protein
VRAEPETREGEVVLVDSKGLSDSDCSSAQIIVMSTEELAFLRAISEICPRLSYDS